MTRTLLGLAVAAVLCAGAGPVAAQSPADPYFHEAAQQYVAGNTAEARRAVERGLEVAPTDPRLLALRKELRQRGRSRGRRDSSSTQSGRGRQSDGAPDGEKSEGGRMPSSESEASRSGPRDEAGPEGRRSGRGASGRRPPGDAPTEQRRGQGGRPVDTLSRVQAERLLRALEGQERRLLRRLRTRSAEHRPIEKDW